MTGQDALAEWNRRKAARKAEVAEHPERETWVPPVPAGCCPVCRLPLINNQCVNVFCEVNHD